MKQWQYWGLIGISFLWISCAVDDSDQTVPQIAPEDRMGIENFQVEATDKDQVLLTWDALAGAEKYKILRKFESDDIYIIQEAVDTNAYASFVYEEHYAFRIWALNALGQIFAESDDVFIDTTGPATPTNFKATISVLVERVTERLPFPKLCSYLSKVVQARRGGKPCFEIE